MSAGLVLQGTEWVGRQLSRTERGPGRLPQRVTAMERLGAIAEEEAMVDRVENAAGNREETPCRSIS